MFTGLVEQIGTIASYSSNELGEVRLRVNGRFDAPPELGASICCSGACLTVVASGNDWFDAELSPETTRVTSASGWAVGTALNLESSLTLNRPLGGHLVTGHVDGVGTITTMQRVGDNTVVWIKVSPDLAQFIAQKGSVTIDGVSLTVNAVEGTGFNVNIIPHTLAVTTLGERQPADTVNIEVDLMARYAARLLEFR